MSLLLQKTLQKTQDSLFKSAQDLLRPLEKETPRRLYEALSYALTSPGKCLRGHLHLQAAAFFNHPVKQALRVATFIEYAHLYSLIHDDLPAMDNAPLRRGLPTTHIVFDEATALLAGNSFLTYAFEGLCDDQTHPDPLTRLKLIQGLAQTMGSCGVMGGQMLDLGTNPTEINELIECEKKKTGDLISFSLTSALLMANASLEDQRRFSYYGSLIGLSYQIVDDILDVTSSEKTLGKPTGQDTKNDKKTWVDFLGVDGAQKKAHHLTEEAIETLAPYQGKETPFIDIAQYILTRKF